VRNALTEQLARERAAEFARAAEAARVRRGGVEARPAGLIATVRMLLARRRSAAARAGERQPARRAASLPTRVRGAGLEPAPPD
jgi:hypothetical protein